jgi:hypothetical protein
MIYLDRLYWYQMSIEESPPILIVYPEIEQEKEPKSTESQR